MLAQTFDNMMKKREQRRVRCIFPCVALLIFGLAARGFAGDAFPTPVGSPGASSGPYQGFGFAWENNDLGLDHSVPAPWTPVKVTGHTVGVWGRTFTFPEAGPWPSELSSAGTPLLARPLRVTLVTSQGSVQWKGSAAITPAAEDRAEIQWHGQEAGLALTVNGSIEFDGFARLDLILRTSRPEPTITELVAEIPFRRSLAKFFSRGFSYDFVQQRSSVASWRGEIGETAGYLDKDLQLSFVNHLWIGDEKRGAELNLPTDFNWAPGSPSNALEIRLNNTEAVLRLNLINRPKVIRGEERFTFAILPTPTKPIPVKNYRQQVLLASSLTGGSKRTLNNELWTFYGILFADSLPLGTWGLPNPPHDPERKAQFDKAMATAARNGLGVIPYSAGCLLSLKAPELEKYRPYWVTNPNKEHKGRSENVMVSHYPKSIRDFLVWNHVEAARTVPQYRGLYFDVADIAYNVTNPNANEYDMARQPAANFKPIYEMRDFYKRVYKAVKAVRPDYLITMHEAKVPQVFGTFAEFMLSGEGLNATFLDAGRALAISRKLAPGQPPYMPDYSLLTDGFWKACYVPQGYVNVFLPQITKTFPPGRNGKSSEAAWRDWFANHPEFVTQHTREMFSRTLVLGLQARSERCDSKVWLSVMRGFERIGGLSDEVEQVPWWEAQRLVKKPLPGLVLAGYLRRRAQEAIVIGANWSAQPVDAPLELNMDEMGITRQGAHVIDLESNVVIGPASAPSKLSVRPNDFRMLLIE